MREIEVARGGRVLRARDAGDPNGPAVMYFHGTPGSRLDLSFDEQVVADSGTRLVSFDRPGYGGSLRQGTSGGGWDNVSWVGEWDIDLSAVRCPVLLWYGSDDKLAPPEYGQYLAQHLPRAQLVMRDGEGHLGLFEHPGEILGELTRPGPVFPNAVRSS
jgi:pimeloyl-ACP methyl ester carboxylesterase